MLKQKGQDAAKAAAAGSDASGRKGSSNYVDSDEVAQITEVKDKQIDVLSNLLAQKQADYKTSKADYEKRIEELETSKTKEVQQKQIEIQKLIVQIGEL